MRGEHQEQPAYASSTNIPVNSKFICSDLNESGAHLCHYMWLLIVLLPSRSLALCFSANFPSPRSCSASQLYGTAKLVQSSSRRTYATPKAFTLSGISSNR